LNYKYNELEYAKQVYEHGFQSPQHSSTELRLVATYMRRILDYSPKKLKEKLYEWCELHIENYNKVLYYKMINKAFNKANKKGSCLSVVNRVDIYVPELDYILGCDIIDENGSEYQYSYECKKLMFTFLARAKLNKLIYDQKSTDRDKTYKGISFSGGQKKYTELKKIAKLPHKLRINEDIIRMLYVSGLVTPLNNGVLKLNFIEDIQKINIQNIAPTIVVDDFERIGWYYDFYYEKNGVVLCKCCNLPFKKKSNKQIYCSDDCSKTMKNEQNKAYYHNKK